MESRKWLYVYVYLKPLATTKVSEVEVLPL
jgi:hypothetical protein